MSKAKVVLAARVNGKQFPFVNVEIRRNAIRLPIEHNGKVYEPDSILGYFARYPHVVGNCLFPGCTGKVQRHVESLGKDHVEAYAKYQRIERDFTRVREGKLPVEEVKPPATGRSLEKMIEEFLDGVKNKKRKPQTFESYAKALDQFHAYCSGAGIRTVDQVDKKAILGFIGWMEKNVNTRNGGHPNNTYRNKLKIIRIFLLDIEHGMPLKPKDWPKEMKARKEKYSVEAVKSMLAAAETFDRAKGKWTWSAEDDKDLIHFVLKTGFRSDEIAHAQYSDINFKSNTINVTTKPKGSFPGFPEIEWTPKDNSAREKDIVIDDVLLKRLQKRKERYHAKSNDLIFSSENGGPSNHLIRVVKRLAKAAGIEGRIGLHKFRKTFATLVAKEEGIEAARLLLGHEDIATTQRYLAADEVAPEQDRKAVRKRFQVFGD